MAAITLITKPIIYTVKDGDCLWTISEQKLGDALKWTEIAVKNDISVDNPVIYTGDKLTIEPSTSTTTTTKNVSTKVSIKYFGRLAGSDRAMFAAWAWDRENTDSYKVRWFYATGNGIWFVGSDTTVKHEDDPVHSYDCKQSTYTAPDNATKVKLCVKPISKSKGNDSSSVYWTAEWSTAKEYNFSNNPPLKPPVPSISIDGYKLTASLNNLSVNGTHIEFQVVRDDATTIISSAKAKINTTAASYTWTVDAGHDYKVRCRSVRDDLYSEWTEYTSNVGTKPAASSGITTIKAQSETSAYLEWGSVANAKAYELEYATKREYFDGSDQTTTVSGIESNHYLKTGLESGQEYLFRVRAVNDDGTSAWTEIKSVILGTTPTAPTTWSSTTTGVTGDSVTLYWVHNSEDGSSQTYAEIELYVDGVSQLLPTIDTTEESDEDKTMYYAIDTSSYSEGVKLQWRVRTAGITKTFGDWSVQRTIDIYAPPTLILSVTNSSGDSLSTITSFPFYISGIAGPNTQTPTGYQVAISANSSYDTTDNMGNPDSILAGEEIYARHFDTSGQLLLEISANSINLENNIEYTVSCTVSMNSGLTATASAIFRVAWAEEYYSPNAEIGINREDVSAYIRPYCEDENGNLVSGVTMSVYRREFDGSFTEIATGLNNLAGTYVTDPHPALDFARYRIVATDIGTGAVSFYDVPGYPVEEHAAIIQWNESWSNFDTDPDETPEEPTWSGSMLKLPYNIDVSDKRSPDASMVKYIGRKHPVSYYGTQLGESQDWKVVIPADDKETLYALRRLSVWMGDVYVREPSGSGYWASISVSFSQTHRQLTIPVSISITRVEGGV